ncbi:Hypothetical Protein FCC1311_067352 [Hondaea fermentalgiana]|uniref:FHA domain-containing protein n=1 Tax=Hondaea fermentalgiana TaxID=2315210 RepID=A0A2R5GIT3_9STRA|nr:Hypothetical Protein FCC1311_067352 [Hondaea fermentalgiana]|eukprot:GBG30515.1 Hypothetical Protein FCC1311_067352 [Hondaea fermentalgiana]
MGGAASIVVKDPESYPSDVSEEMETKLLAKTKIWRIFSEDLEWATLRIRTNQAPLTVGRSHENAIPLANRTTSAKHAILSFDAQTCRWAVTDVGSSTGTMVFAGGKSKTLEKETEFSLGLSCAIRFGKSIVTLVSNQLSSDAIIECTRGPLKGKAWRVPTAATLLTAGASAKCEIDLSDVEGLSKMEFQIFKYNGWFAISDVSVRSSALREDDDAQQPAKEGKKIKAGNDVGEGNNVESGDKTGESKAETSIKSAASSQKTDFVELENAQNPDEENQSIPEIVSLSQQDVEELDGAPEGAEAKYKSSREATKAEKKLSQNGIYLNGRQVRRREMNFLWTGCRIGVGVYKPAEKKVSFPAVFVFKCKLKSVK